MLDMEDICQWIDRLEKGRATPQNYEFLACLYIIRDHADGKAKKAPFTKETAEERTSTMVNEDGSHGAHWTFDQAKRIMEQRSIEENPVEWWAAINMIYSDYYEVAKKHNVGGTVDFFADMAKAFLDDKDAGPNKIARYYECVVK